MFFNSMKATASIAGALVLVLSQTALAATGSTILEKRQVTVAPSGATRTTECLVYADGVTVKRDIVGLQTTEEKNFKLGGNVDAKIAEVVATKPQTKTVGPLEYTYSMIAFYTTAAGARESVILSSFNGTTGEDIFNPSPASNHLRDVLNTACGN